MYIILQCICEDIVLSKCEFLSLCKVLI
jgi:hypothetical protein